MCPGNLMLWKVSVTSSRAMSAKGRKQTVWWTVALYRKRHNHKPIDGRKGNYWIGTDSRNYLRNLFVPLRENSSSKQPPCQRHVFITIIFYYNFFYHKRSYLIYSREFVTYTKLKSIDFCSLKHICFFNVLQHNFISNVFEYKVLNSYVYMYKYISTWSD